MIIGAEIKISQSSFFVPSLSRFKPEGDDGSYLPSLSTQIWIEFSVNSLCDELSVLFLHIINTTAYPWSSLVEGVEQLDQPNSQTTMELFHAYVVLLFLGLTYTLQLSAWADTGFISFY